MLGPDQTEVDNIYEVRFKNTRKAFYRNVNGLRLYIGDWVVVESDRGYDVGVLSLGGVMAELQMKKKKVRTALKDIPRIYRKANEKDIELLGQVREREPGTLSRAREIIQELKLDMKLSDVEYQADNAKAIFYYIADHRVDFRELIKLLAREFRIRVEMKQIGLRHEAGLVGGIGSCGRELCCSTWLTEFKTVSTSAARYQNLSLNPMKISGLCGRLKCCLNFELDSYLDALQDFPKVDRIETAKGRAILQKTDIFKGLMWFSYLNETSWYPLSVEEVKRIMALNEQGEKPEMQASTITSDELGADEKFDFVDVVGTALPEIEKRSNRRKSKKRRGPKKPAEGQSNEQAPPANRRKSAPKAKAKPQTPPEGKTEGKAEAKPKPERKPREQATGEEQTAEARKRNNNNNRRRRGGNRRRPQNQPKKDE